MIGLINQVGAIAGLILCSMFGVYPIFCGKLSKRMEVWGSSILIVLSLLSLVLLAIIWDAPAVVNLCSVFGSIVGHGSILLLFPLIAINYSGWLVAPVRSGTDLSSMISAFLAEAQTSDGVNQRFPTWLLFTLYSIISCCGLVAWTVILKYGIGLRAHATDEELGGTPRFGNTGRPDVESETSTESKSNESISEHKDTKSSGAFVRERLAIGLQSLFCPKPLVAPVAMAALTQITQWSIAANLGEIGAEMCDPLECGGTEGRFVFRLSLTLSQILVPLGSLVSSVGACPRWLFYCISLLQYISCGLVCAAALGLWRSMWMTAGGQALFISSFALCGMLEGYVITMTYRYIGDAESIPLAQRHSAGALLSIASVILVSVGSLILGGAVANGDIQCIDP